LKALLGVIAVAGYHNRDKTGELLRGIHPPSVDRTVDRRPHETRQGTSAGSSADPVDLAISSAGFRLAEF
jgi:hypothetical protein